MRIIVIDSSENLSEQLSRISRDIGLPVPELLIAWQNAHPTIVPKLSDIYIEEIKPEVYKPPKKLSYTAQQKSLPKFLRR